jgi:hypothetical protein
VLHRHTAAEAAVALVKALFIVLRIVASTLYLALIETSCTDQWMADTFLSRDMAMFAIAHDITTINMSAIANGHVSFVKHVVDTGKDLFGFHQVKSATT